MQEPGTTSTKRHPGKWVQKTIIAFKNSSLCFLPSLAKREKGGRKNYTLARIFTNPTGYKNSLYEDSGLILKQTLMLILFPNTSLSFAYK